MPRPYDGGHREVDTGGAPLCEVTDDVLHDRLLPLPPGPLPPAGDSSSSDVTETMDKVTPVPSAVGIVLAAGAGRRFGMPKVLAEDGAWLRAAVAALDAGGCRPVYVVLGAAQVVMPPPALALSLIHI